MAWSEMLYGGVLFHTVLIEVNYIHCMNIATVAKSKQFFEWNRKCFRICLCGMSLVSL